MNKVEVFWGDSIYGLKRAINEFAEDYEIINVSLVANTTQMGTCGYSAMVLYKV